MSINRTPSNQAAANIRRGPLGWQLCGFPYNFLTRHHRLPYRNAMPAQGILLSMEKEHIMLDFWFVALGLGLIGLMAGYLALLRKA
ncbi:MAG: hypothetical protein ABIQ85_00360 [Cypionkella sp.]